MTVNYFNTGARSKSNYGELAKTVEDVEFNIMTKISKLSNVKGNVIVESTLDGEVQEGMLSVTDLTNMIGAVKTDTAASLNALETTKLNKLSPDTGAGHIVITDANGGVVTSSITPQEIEAKSIPKITNPKDVRYILAAAPAGAADGYIMVSDGAGGVREGYMSQGGFITRIGNHIADINDAAGDKLILSTSDGNVKESALAEADITNKIPKIPTAVGDKIALSKVNGDVKESTLTEADITNKIPKIPTAVGDKIALSEVNGDVKESTLTEADITNKIPKITNPKDFHGNELYDGYIMVSDGAGGVREGHMSQEEVATRVANRVMKMSITFGDKIVLSKTNGDVKESALTVADITNKMPKISNAVGGKLLISEANGDVKESDLGVNDIRQGIFKDSYERFSFPGPLLLPHKRRLLHDATFLGITVDLKINN